MKAQQDKISISANKFLHKIIFEYIYYVSAGIEMHSCSFKNNSFLSFLSWPNFVFLCSRIDNLQ